MNNNFTFRLAFTGNPNLTKVRIVIKAFSSVTPASFAYNKNTTAGSLSSSISSTTIEGEDSVSTSFFFSAIDFLKQKQEQNEAAGLKEDDDFSEESSSALCF
jgi:hypothetical protein